LKYQEGGVRPRGKGGSGKEIPPLSHKNSKEKGHQRERILRWGGQKEGKTPLVLQSLGVKSTRGGEKLSFGGEANEKAPSRLSGEGGEEECSTSASPEGGGGKEGKGFSTMKGEKKNMSKKGATP